MQNDTECSRTTCVWHISRIVLRVIGATFCVWLCWLLVWSICTDFSKVRVFPENGGVEVGEITQVPFQKEERWRTSRYDGTFWITGLETEEMVQSRKETSIDMCLERYDVLISENELDELFCSMDKNKLKGIFDSWSNRENVDPESLDFMLEEILQSMETNQKVLTPKW